MAILFDWYEDPRPSDKQQGKRTLHPRIRYNGTIGTDLVRQRIQERCSLTETGNKCIWMESAISILA